MRKFFIGLATALLITTVASVCWAQEPAQAYTLEELSGLIDRFPAYLKKEIKSGTVELNGPAHRQILGRLADLEETVRLLVEGRLGGNPTAAAPIAAQPTIPLPGTKPAADYASSVDRYVKAVDEQVKVNDRLINEMNAGQSGLTTSPADTGIMARLSEVERISISNQGEIEVLKEKVKTWEEFLDEQTELTRKYRAKLGASQPTSPCK